MEHSTTSKGEKEKLCTSPESNIVQALNCTPTLQESNSGTRTSDGVDNTSSVKVNTEPASVKEAQDDECQIVSSRSKTPSPLASPITHIAKRRQVQDPAIIALDSMFRIIYNKAPIDSQLDMKLVLSQIENLISAAEYYELLPAVRASIGYSLAQRGRFLFREIFFRPIQWLNVSVELENKIIFQEAVVHLVGKFPDVDHFPRQFSGTSKGVRDLVYRKVVDMDRAISKVNESLMTSAIYESEIRVQLNGLNKYSFDVSILVHCWREWFIRRLMEARSPSVRPEEPNVQSKLAMLYRDIAAGGDTYLPEGEVMDSLRPFQLQGADQTDGFLQWDTAADDLALIKDYASRTVREICTNRSQLNHADGYFKYLTCTDVGDYELPWVSAPRN
ncbi:hypothetical protein V493_05092 [Pseudogymnoascus sp. VKM F-4281 (FW-2241)]|nr:hypothetical protein V493_05092 [Pseudogymnoascus sp. VKM F-4281 (FW-2241)]